MRWTLPLASFLVACGSTYVLPGCSSTEPHATASDCEAFATTMVASFATCALPSDVVGADLRARFVDRCRSRVEAVGSGVTPSWLESCAAALSEACDPYGTCLPIPGTLADGAGCANHDQCASGFCRPSYSGSCGTCAVATAREQSGICPPGKVPVTDYQGPVRCDPPGRDHDLCFETGAATTGFFRACAYTFTCVRQTSNVMLSTGECRPDPLLTYGPPLDPSTCH